MDTPIRLAGVIKESIVDGPGLRFTVFVQGCPHHCPGCHNPQTHPFTGGTLTSAETIYSAFRENPLLAGITLSGGEPFCQAGALLPLAKMVKQSGKNVMAYTGYTLEQLEEKAVEEPEIGELLATLSWLVDGRFLLEQRSLNLQFRGSSNQRIIDIPYYLQTKTVRQVDFASSYCPEFEKKGN